MNLSRVLEARVLMFNGHEKMISGRFRKKQMWICRWRQFSGNHCYNPVNLIIIIARRFGQSIFLVTSFLKLLASTWNKIWRETPENRGPSRAFCNFWNVCVLITQLWHPRTPHQLPPFHNIIYRKINPHPTHPVYLQKLYIIG